MFPKFEATRRYEQIETQVQANSTITRIPFNDQPQLRTDQTRDVIIQGLETFTVTDVTLSPNNIAVVTAAFLKQTYLVLYVDNEESIYRIPMLQLHRISNLADPFIFSGEMPPKFENIFVDWTKSYFFTPTPYAGGVFATFSFLLGVHYKILPPGTAAKIRMNEYNLYCNYIVTQRQ
jgi:hypothetical protein